MTTRYQNEHYEDVARLIRESWPVEDDSREAEEVVLFSLLSGFADLFAADNPRICIYCQQADNKETTQSCTDPGAGHTFSGFDRKQFLAACGLEPRSVKEQPGRHGRGCLEPCLLGDDCPCYRLSLEEKGLVEPPHRYG